jgi:hypothetical protein
MTQPKLPNVVKTIISHTPVITIFIGGMVSIPKWVVSDIVLTTLKQQQSQHLFMLK